METEIRTYEIGYFLRGDLGEEKAQETAETARKLLEERGGIIIRQENKPQTQNLAYPIKNHKTGYFGSFKVILPVEKIISARQSLLNLDFIRLLISREKQEETSSRRSKKRIFKKLQDSEKGIGPAKINVSTKGSSGRVEQNGSLQAEEIDKKLEEILKE